jgi:bifunctional non-homologous end joining protein LigD
MKLTAHKREGDSSGTPEPRGSEDPDARDLRFVVQRHDASTLHSDFRLELDGVLKSWAVPKGPSMNPSVRRLAVQVEDHPLEYRTFQGTAPEASHGAGEVRVWDEGTYESPGDGSPAEGKKRIRQGLERGKMSFILHGARLKGAFTMIRLNSDNRKSWLLLKNNDEFVQDGGEGSEPALEASGPPPVRNPSGSRTSPGVPKPGPPSEIAVGRHTVAITHPGKLYWPGEGISKMDLVDYYLRMAPAMVPHLRDRPQALHRHPNGIDEPGFFQKNLKGALPGWISTVTVKAASTGREVRYFVCTDAASLIVMVNAGCIEINPWFSRVPALDRPDVLVFDLDPVEIGFDAVIDCALAVKELLDQARLPSFPKTSGATGMHIYVPLHATHDFDTVREFAEFAARAVHARMPEATSLERSPVRRKRRVYLDYLRNSFSQTLAAPYSVRPRKGAPVSAPLAWEEVKSGLDPMAFTMWTMPERLKSRGDLFKGTLGRGGSLEAARRRLASG